MGHRHKVCACLLQSIIGGKSWASAENVHRTQCPLTAIHHHGSDQDLCRTHPQSAGRLLQSIIGVRAGCLQNTSTEHRACLAAIPNQVRVWPLQDMPACCNPSSGCRTGPLWDRSIERGVTCCNPSLRVRMGPLQDTPACCNPPLGS